MKKANASAKTCSRHQRVVRISLPAACCIVAAVAVLNSPIARADTSFGVSLNETRTEPGSYTIGDGVDATVRIDGGRWEVPSDLTVGDHGGTGSLEITRTDYSWGSVYVKDTLRLNPGGTLTLDGGDLSVGAIDMAGGTFNWVSGQLRYNGEYIYSSSGLQGNVRVHHGERLDGMADSKAIIGNVVNNGDVDCYLPLLIIGNYTQNANATLDVQKAGLCAIPNGKLTVAGTATINGGMVRPEPIGTRRGHLKGGQFCFLHADQGITGAFDGIIQPATVTFAIKYDANNAYLVVTANTYYASHAATKNQRSLAALLDSTQYFGTATDWYLSMYSEVVLGNQQVLEENNPAIFDAFTSVSFDTTAAYLSATSRGFRHLGLSPSATSPTAPMAFDDLSPQAPSGQPLHLSTNPPAAPASDPNLTLWASGISNWSGQHNSNQARGDDVFTSGVAVGGDYRISPSASVGLSLGYTHSDIDWQEDAATGNGQTGYGSLYGNWADSGFWADAILGMGLSWYDATRNIPTFGRSADSDFTAQDYFTRLGGGYDWKLGRWTVGPLGSLQYINSQQGSFSETGADSLDLTVDDRDANSLQSGLGLRAGYTIDVGRTRLTPSVRAQWVHEYFNDPRAIDASIAGAGDAQFRVHGDAPTRDSALLGLGLDASMTQSVAL